ncbi:MAG: DUF790 family protein [Candidatus Heimdallarchaeota archaeon]
MVPLGSIPFHYDKRTRRTLPIFLSQEDEEIIEKAITVFDSNQGISRSDYVNESFLQNFKDFRRASLLHEVLGKHFFGFRPIQKGFSPKERIRIWKAFPKMMNEGYSLSSEHRQEILGELASDFSMDNPDVLERRLFYDHRDYQKLTQTNSPSTEAIISEYNRLILKTIIQNSRWVRFSIDPKANLEGGAFKRLLFLAKRYGAHFEVFMKDQRRVIELLGPKKLVQRGGRYSASLGRIMKAATNFALGDPRFESSIELGLPRGKGERVVLLSREALEWIHEEIDEEKVVFDSKVEKRLFHQLQSPQWKIKREPFLHFEKESLFFLPDFQLDLHGSQETVYLEVVGFWTKEYLEKKVEKLGRLPKTFDNLLLLVDSALAFPQTRFPTFYYQSLKSLPVGEILGYLDKKYVQPYSQSKQKELLANAEILGEEVAQAVNISKFLEMEEIQEIMGCEDSKIISRVVEELLARGNLKDCSLVPNFGIIHQYLANSTRETILPIFSEQKIQPWSRIEAALSEVVPQTAIEAILKLAGFEVVWKGLTQKFVRVKRRVV